MTKTLFLTGASSGIGQAITKQLTANGWKVIAPSHSELDLADLDAVTKFASSTDFPAEEINALIHVAGIWHDQDSVLADKPFGKFTPEQLTQTVNVGLTSFMLLTNRLLAKGKPEHIIAISGTFESGAKGWLPYYTSKRALEDFLAGLAQDTESVTVYGISPADTATEAYKRFYPEYARTAQSPRVVAELVSSLLSGAESYTSGSIIELRDGRHKPGYHV